MFKLKKKKLAYPAVIIALLFTLAVLIPVLRKPVLDTLKYPLQLLTFIKREVMGAVFYHANYIQNERLKREIDSLRRKINESEETSLENARLKKLLNYKQQSPYKVLAAKAIGRSPDNWSSVIIIDKGRHSGIRRGMAVISYLGLVGSVRESTDYTSQVMLINDLNSNVSALIQRSREEGLVSATLGGSLIMRYLPKEADINVSDAVITSGITPLYPKGLLIGMVVEKGEEFSGLSSYAIIKPAVDLSSLEEVLVIIQ